MPERSPTHSKRPRIIHVFVLLFVAFAATSTAADFRLGDEVVPRSQTVRLKLDAGHADYSGSVQIELAVRETTDHFLLHSERATLESVRLRGERGPIEIAFRHEGEDLVRIDTPEPLAEGRYSLRIEFTSTFSTQSVGLYRLEKDGAAYAFTQFQADDAREAFPCWDEPRFKIPYRLILTVPEKHLALANTPIVEETSEDGWRTVTFQTTRPLPSYLVALAVGPFEVAELPGLGVPGRIVTVAGQSHLTTLAARLTPLLLDAFEEYFKSSYPYEKLDLIAVPDFWPGAMENPGAVTYTDAILLLDERTASVEERQLLASVTAHEIAHQWFGNLVTMQWWDDFWLNEAFADWLGDKIAHQVFPSLRLDVTATQETQSLLARDARSTARAIRREVSSAKNAFSGIDVTFVKGSAVLGMFEAWLGSEVFRRGVIRYIESHKWGNARAADLWRALDEASKRSAGKALETFIGQPGFPRVDVELLEDGRAKLRQERFRSLGSSSPELLWHIPVTLKYAAGGRVAERTVLLDAAEKTFDLGLPEGQRPEWIYPNRAARGYYRWRVPAEELRRLAAEASAVLEPRERIELLGNLSALLDAGAVAGDTYLDVLGNVASDPDASVVTSVTVELGRVKGNFVAPELEEDFARYVRRILGPSLARIGRDPRAGEASAAARVRPVLYRWLGEEGRDPEILAHAGALARAYMDDPSSADPALVDVALELRAFGGDRELFDELRRRFEEAAAPNERRRYLEAMGSFAEPALQRAALDFALRGPLHANELFLIPLRLRRNEAGRDLVFDWLTRNYEAITARAPPVVVASTPFLASGCSQERLDRARAFFSTPKHTSAAVEEAVRSTAEQVRECIELRRREGSAVRRFLRQP